MKCQINLLSFSLLWLVSQTFGEPPPARPLIFKSFPQRSQTVFKSNPGMMLQLRGSGSTKIVSRLPAPNVYIKSQNPMQFAIPSRIINRPLKAAPSSHIYFKSPPSSPLKKQPFSASSSNLGFIKFSSPSQKTAIKFKTPPPIPQKSKPDFVFEKVTLPKFAEPVLGTEAAIHQIAAPNLSLNQLDSDLTKVSVQAFSIEKPAISTQHQPQSQPQHYQVQENLNDLTFKNIFTGQKKLVAPDPDIFAYNKHPIHLSSDPLLNTPSDGQPKPADVLYHQNIEFNASPLVQQHYVTDPFTFPVTSQPQLQQYHLQQNAMIQQGLPLAAYNPTYLVMQSINLLGQHQQHLTPNLFSPAHGYVDTSHSQQQQQQLVAPDYTKNYEVASLGQIYAAQKDLYHQLHDVVTSTLSPSTASGYHYDISSIASQTQNIPAIAQLEPKPVVNNYQHSHNNFVDYPEEQLSSNDIQNFLAYDDVYRRQIENDLILQEAHEKLQGKLELQKQQEQAISNLHQLALGEKYNTLRLNPIIVPDEFQKRTDGNNEDSYEEVDDVNNFDPTTTDKPTDKP